MADIFISYSRDSKAIVPHLRAGACGRLRKGAMRIFFATFLLVAVAHGQTFPIVCVDLRGGNVLGCSQHQGGFLVKSVPADNDLVFWSNGDPALAGPSPDDDLQDFSYVGWRRWSTIPDNVLVGACFGDLDGSECINGTIGQEIKANFLNLSPPPNTGSGIVHLAWEPSTRNEDGTIVDDLAGYFLYWGQQSGNYPNFLQLPITVEHDLILNVGTYFFVLTAFDLQGNESAFSNEAQAIVTYGTTVDLIAPNPPTLTIQGRFREVCTDTGIPGQRLCVRQ